MTDLRSDTVTRPTRPMLEAMFAAEVGDDVFGEDPTVKALEERLAAMFGMEAGLFCASGTMANQVAIRAHTSPGDEVICDESAHIYHYEGAGPAMNAGVSLRIVHGRGGILGAGDIRKHVRAPADYSPRSRLVVIENTCNITGGNYYGLAQIAELSEACRELRLSFHLDGARIFNALAASGDSAAAYGKHFDSIAAGLCKGLGCPVGSVLLGRRDFIGAARRIRKNLGGGMRQAGYLAAAGLYALDHNLPLLHDDHRRAGELGAALEQQDYVEEVLPVHTNIVIFRLRPEAKDSDFITHLEKNGVRAIAIAPQTIRFVTHLDVSDAMVEEVKKALNAFISPRSL